MFFRFPPVLHWNPERSLVGFGIGVGGYDGLVRVPRRVFQHLLAEAPTPERCAEAYHLHRTRFDRIAERKLRRRQLTMTPISRSPAAILREREPRAAGQPATYRAGATLSR